jgi:hypothetical protein
MRIYKPIDISDFTLESTRECDLSDENLAKYTNGIMSTGELCELITNEILYDTIVGEAGRLGPIN